MDGGLTRLLSSSSFLPLSTRQFITGIFFLCAGIPLFVSSLVVFWLTLKKVDRFNKMSTEARANLRSSCMIVIW